MKRRDLDRIVSLVDNNLLKTIRVALHLHENMSLSCCLAQSFIDKHLNRPVAVDGSLMGMGRIPGNLPIELIADYANDYLGKTYDIDCLLDAINDYVAQIKGRTKWGYTPAYFLSAKYNLHRNYSEYYLKKGDLTNRDINHILSHFDSCKKTKFDVGYAEMRYEDYKNNQINDSEAWDRLKEKLYGKKILVLAPGYTIKTHSDTILSYINEKKPIVIGANFIPDDIKVDYAFFSNNKRFCKVEEHNCQIIVTSNLTEGSPDFRINYNSVSGAFNQGCNSLIMLLKLLKNIGVANISLAGADGYKTNENNYYNRMIKSSTVHGSEFNLAVKDAIHNLGINVRFITPSEYEEK